MSSAANSATDRSAYVIVGGGLTAARAVEGIREHDAKGSIVVVTEEDRLPYERPPLSKGVLKGDDEVDSVFTHPEAWYADQDVELRLGDPATSLDADEHVVTLRSGESLSYEKLLLATGSSARALDAPGADLDGVLYLRELQESMALKEAFADGARVVIVGAGWIGLEVAAAAADAGCSVTVVEPQAAPLLGVMGEQVGGWFADLHRSHGVTFRFGEGVSRIEGTERADAVVTTTGERLPTDVVVVGVGITPNTGLAQGAGLEVDNGIVTDARLRTSADGVWAAGDVANWESTTLGTHVRVEHWANANDGGLAAGRSMAGADVTYDPVPFFFSDQYDVGLEYAGHVPRGSGAEVVLRGEPSSNEFMAFWVVPEGDGVRVLAGMHVNVWDTIDAVQQLVRDRTVVGRDRLADPAVALDQLTS
ncbi:NAD(P)/FAD-dependent oxidoreductase [Humibacillus xanthopallidus]|uniref:3-phenylpropionate/trans-cinnamate dioxygenase ferredoxin reductase subunit n=1 Tax=Humibacillus xanthopallidus TaxID=412689 RepID=A0A543I0K8_9MICO|nr:FAD-dependent oxidoreductase [Humibacillus xanthopallidus]TQM64025.1 3-phenylpropionate/trans-cinnamate dioxygenase ferredoxin reductase subunit [Humibacillus xanthopallidus]